MPPAESQTPSSIELLKKYLGPLVAGLFVARIVAVYALTALFIPIQTDITFPEGALVARAMDVAQGRTPYHDWRQWPHAFAPYPPLAYYPAGWIARAAGATNDPYAIYIVGRSISFAALLGIFAVLYLLGRRLGLGPAWSLAGVGLLGQFQMLVEYCVSYRPDAPKTFFALLALFIVARGEGRGAGDEGRGAGGEGTHNPPLTTHNSQLATCNLQLATIWAALGCLIVSAWFKPTAWGIGIVLLVWLWRRLGWRKGLAATAAFVIAGAGPLLLLNHHWHGLLLLNLVDSLQNGLTLDGFRRNATIAYLPALAVALAGCAAAAAGLRTNKWRGARGEGQEETRGEGLRTRPSALPGERLILAAALASMLAGLAQFFKVGSDVNYFLDGYPLAALALTWGVARLWRGEVRWPAGLRAAAIGVVLTPLALLAGLDLSVIGDPFKVGSRLWSETQIQHLARRTPGPIMASNPFVQLTHPGEAAIMDYFQFAILVRRGRIDPGELLRRVRAKTFRQVIISEPILNLGGEGPDKQSELYCRDFLPALLGGYRLERKVAIFYVYVPITSTKKKISR